VHEPGESLSERELQILALIAEHYTNDEIAGRLHLSKHTVKKHVDHILEKLGVVDRGEAARWWQQRITRNG
jgi:DNA-binding CsgD family transcriptional regulator